MDLFREYCNTAWEATVSWANAMSAGNYQALFWTVFVMWAVTFLVLLMTRAGLHAVRCRLAEQKERVTCGDKPLPVPTDLPAKLFQAYERLCTSTLAAANDTHTQALEHVVKTIDRMMNAVELAVERLKPGDELLQAIEALRVNNEHLAHTVQQIVTERLVQVTNQDEEGG
jgi:hypothetical protein